MYQQMHHSWVKYIIWQKENLFLFVRIAERDVKHRNPTANTKIWMKLPLARIELQSDNLTQLFKNQISQQSLLSKQKQKRKTKQI